MPPKREVTSSPNSRSLNLGKADQELKPFLDKVDNVSEYLKFLVRRDIASNDNKCCTDYNKYKYNFDTPLANADSSNIPDTIPDYLAQTIKNLVDTIVSEKLTTTGTEHTVDEETVNKPSVSDEIKAEVITETTKAIIDLAKGQGNKDKI